MQEQRLSSTCFHFDELFRNDSGVYTCIAENEGGIGTKNITLVVSYSPSVKLIYINFTERDKERVIQCVANGHPMNYSYRQWEHQTVFDEHIRYLTGNATGFLSLPIQKRKLRYQDTGVYVCSVSNGIQDTRGKLFQKEQGYVISKGTPRFVKDNTNKQYGIEGHQLDVKVKLYSLSNITCQLIESKGDLRMTPSVQINHVNVSAYFHGKNVKVPGLEVMFRFSELSKTDFKEYVVTVCNEFGNSSLTLELLPKNKHSSKEKSVTSEGIVIAVLLILIVVLLVVMGVYVTQNNQMVSADSRLVVENRNIFIVSEEHNLTLSNNDSDTSEHTIASLDNEIDALEHLDDGYERPYTTILAHNYAENEHCYSSIEKGLTNDTTSQNAACGPYIVFTERDKHNISICTDDAQQNTKRSMGEYINLSLKQ
ncbi:Hypothetical predicted protein [Mytilus galloprovincialis]|uniref:Ig-like domain-containing protein n=1 Tax=Mytilus galloprovincialis TaxID=29158 RepID=A0A8B6FAR3_MYTGA|nr:Hypothetical predicted protein [Mytilus galloprovincialis]